MNMLLNTMLNVTGIHKRQWLSAFTLLLALSLLGFVPPAAMAASGDLYGQPGTSLFGYRVVTLTNGNFVVAELSHEYRNGLNVGAVFLYEGGTNRLISTLLVDGVGLEGLRLSVFPLTNGNFVVVYPYWNGVGSATWVNGTTGLNGTVSRENSLVGSTDYDEIGGGGVVALTNGNYVVMSRQWNAPGVAHVGAATWGNGSTGTVGVVSSANSLVGSSNGDMAPNPMVSYHVAGIGGVVPLKNGNYLVSNPDWDSPNTFDAGAVTWGNGATGVSGVISSANSLVGRAYRLRALQIAELTNGNYVICSADGVATWGNGATGTRGEVSRTNSLMAICTNIVALTNGNYVVASHYWNRDIGAATWGDGTKGIAGNISSTNSLIGNHSGSFTGSKVVALTNGNYVVVSAENNGSGEGDVGAVTWGNGATGVVGVVSQANSLVGTQPYDSVGNQVVALTNGNYVVGSYAWRPAGWQPPIGQYGLPAATWANGTTGITGVVSATNSLLGTGEQLVALSNGNYVAANPYWDANATLTNVGSATWGNGATGTIGVVSAANSLVGSAANNQVGEQLLALSNGNYAVVSPHWDSGPDGVNVGAVTWGSGTSGTVGSVSAANSLVGSLTDDQVGERMAVLSNGNYVVSSPHWDLNVSIQNAGAVTWANGAAPAVGAVSPANSLVGGSFNDFIGDDGIDVLPNGDYIVRSSLWRVPGYFKAATWGKGTGGTTGTVLENPSMLGTSPSTVFWWGPTLYNPVHGQVLIGIVDENRVAILQVPSISTIAPPSGEVGWPYQYTLMARGAPAPHFRVVQGSLPPGLVLEPNGILHGTPTQAGVFAFTVVASNGIQPDATRPFTFTVALENTHTWLPVARR